MHQFEANKLKAERICFSNIFISKNSNKQQFWFLRISLSILNTKTIIPKLSCLIIFSQDYVVWILAYLSVESVFSGSFGCSTKIGGWWWLWSLMGLINSSCFFFSVPEFGTANSCRIAWNDKRTQILLFG